MNATTPIWTLVATLALASLACTPASADDAPADASAALCLPVYFDNGVHVDWDCVPLDTPDPDPAGAGQATTAPN
jgi:hypothetical protein